MDRCVNYGTHLVATCDRSAGERHVISITMLGLHVVEALDAIAVLLRYCCADPAKVLLRNEMEAMFGIEYMAQSDSERKAIQYLLAHAHNRIDWYNKLNPTTETGKQLKAQFAKDSTFHDLDVVSLDTAAEIANLEKMLSRPEYSAVEAEWQRTKKERGGKLWWYSLFEGPRNIEGLAGAVHGHGWYEGVYRIYSGEIHATNAIESLHTNHDMTASYQPLRYPIDLPNVAQMAVSIALRTYRCLIDMLVPAEKANYKHWYMREIKPDFSTLDEFRIDDSTRMKRTPRRHPGSPSK